MSYERTPEHRRQQAERMRAWRPWEKSTGPRTEAGKAVSRYNALKHGARSADAIAQARRINGWIREARAKVKAARVAR